MKLIDKLKSLPLGCGHEIQSDVLTKGASCGLSSVNRRKGTGEGGRFKCEIDGTISLHQNIGRTRYDDSGLGVVLSLLNAASRDATLGACHRRGYQDIPGHAYDGMFLL